MVRDRAWSFREHLYGSFTRWVGALFELCDAVLCGVGPVSSIPSLNLELEFARSHGSLYKALAKGWINEDRLRRKNALGWTTLRSARLSRRTVGPGSSSVP